MKKSIFFILLASSFFTSMQSIASQTDPGPGGGQGSPVSYLTPDFPDSCKKAALNLARRKLKSACPRCPDLFKLINDPNYGSIYEEADPRVSTRYFEYIRSDDNYNSKYSTRLELYRGAREPTDIINLPDDNRVRVRAFLKPANIGYASEELIRTLYGDFPLGSDPDVTERKPFSVTIEGSFDFGYTFNEQDKIEFTYSNCRADRVYIRFGKYSAN